MGATTSGRLPVRAGGRGTVTLAVLGDSTAAGLGDPVRGGGFRGFGGLLAEALGDPQQVSLVNTGRSGARVACVRRDQLPVALAARPQIAVVLVGMNDTLRADFDPRALSGDFSATVRALAAAGASVLTVRYHDHSRVLPLPRPLAGALRTRISALNGAIDQVVREERAWCLDLGTLPGCYEPSAWSVDRLHPSERGHRLLARAIAELLVAAGHPVARLDSLAGRDGPVPSRAQRARWLLTRGVPWLYRRRDLIPLMLGAVLHRVFVSTSAARPCVGRSAAPNIDS